MIKELFLDTETTGLSQKSGLYQIGGIIRYGNTYEEFEFNCDIFEDDEINPEAIKMAKISIKDLAKFPSPEETYFKLLETLGRHVDKFNKTDKFIAIGYGVEFDMKVLRRWFEGMGDQFFGSWFWTPWICVMSLAAQRFKEVRPTMPNFKLKTVLEKAGIYFDDDKLHSALYDAKKAMELYDWLTQVQRKETKLEIDDKTGKKIYHLNKK